MANREAFIDFVHGLLNINPLERWSPQQARTHPFITQQKYTGPFQPQMSSKPKHFQSREPRQHKLSKHNKRQVLHTLQECTA
jgi:dual specificity protein kinase YAK1